MRYLLVALFILAAGCKVVEPPEPSTVTPTLRLSTDTTYGLVHNGLGFSVRWSDTSGRASKYVWDLGNGYTTSTTATALYYSYSTAGRYAIHVLALNAEDSVIASAKGVAIVQSQTYSLALDSSSYTITNDSTVTFHATLTPASFAEYVWTLDDDSPISTRSVGTFQTSFTTNGHHWLYVQAKVFGEVVARDSAEITVTLPTVSADELSAMGSLDVIITSNQDNLHTSFSLIGGAGNSAVRNGNHELVTNYAASHIDLGNGRYRDTSVHKRIEWQFVNNRYLDSVKLVMIDSTMIGTVDSSVLYVWHAAYPASNLKLVSRTRDAVEFDGISIYTSPATGSDTTRFPVPPATGSDCGTPARIQFGRLQGANIQLIFHPPH